MSDAHLGHEVDAHGTRRGQESGATIGEQLAEERLFAVIALEVAERRARQLEIEVVAHTDSFASSAATEE